MREMLYLVLLCYYESYFKNAIEEFGALASDLGREYRLVVVNNGSFVIDAGPAFAVIEGDNTNWEFTGWDCGLGSLGSIGESDYFIFANDTFNRHRSWTLQNRAEFVSAFSLMLEDQRAGICGQIHRAKDGFSIEGRRVSMWVSTYLFGMSGRVLKANNFRLSLSEEQLFRLVPGVTERRVVWGAGVNEALRSHIDKWVFPVVGGGGWYKADVATPSEKCRKVKAILNEKFLSALCEEMGYSFVQARPLTIRRIVQGVVNRAKVWRWVWPWRV